MTRFDQVIPSIVERDAVSNHTFEAQRVLRSMGYVSEIFAGNWGPGVADLVRPLRELPSESGQWICYQASIGSPAAEAFASHPGRKVVNYHNISPADLVEPWMPSLGAEVHLGRQQMRDLAAITDVGIGVSAYNAAELDAWGYKATAVAPLLSDVAAVGEPPDSRLAGALASAKGGGGSDWLFVGQFLPHKGHHDVVKAFACNLKLYDSKARLHLVGRPSCGAYALAVRRLAENLGIAPSVNFAGSVTAAELSAYYACSDVFVCCSDHEGFCAPLLEAMGHGVPVVAYGAAAVPETVTDAGIVLSEKWPTLVAAAAATVAGDPGLAAELVAKGRARASTFTLAAARQAFRDAVSLAIEQPHG